MYGNIILQTKYFPYNNGEAPAESFLEKEIRVLAQQAERVYVLAFDARPGSSVTAQLPPNVTAYSLGLGRQNKVGHVLRGARYVFDRKLLRQEEIEPLRLDKMAFLAYFMGKSDLKWERLKKSGFLNDILPGKTLIYNFWFFDYARTAVLLRDALRRKGFENVGCISRAHGYDLYAYRNKMDYLPLRPWLLSEMDHVFPCSEDGARYLANRYPQYRDKIQTMYLGTEDHGVQQKKPDHIFTVISCSRVIALKRAERIVDALALLDVPCRWIHFGGGELLEDLKEKAEKKLQGTFVTWEITGTLPNEEVLKRYGQLYADCFINVSESEGLPLSIMEAMSFGIPVVATDVGGTPEIAEDGVNGILLPKDFTDEVLARHIRFFREKEVEEFRRNARKKWEQSFRYETNTVFMLQTAEQG